MKVVFKIAQIKESAVCANEFVLVFCKEEYQTYPEAEKGIDELPAGTYQVQKVSVKEEIYEHSAKVSNSTDWLKTKTFA